MISRLANIISMRFAGYEQITTKYNGLNTTVTANGVTTYSIIPTSNSTTTANGFMDPNGW